MYLKSFTIKGFKTFAEKEELVFDSPTGITAVVGPNGCGKSNIVDSFRFSLGENNIRGLRVHSLPDIIFAGTEKRKALSLAEVMLVFDNTDKSVPYEYSEIAVRRRTYKDGESEFFINNQACRLKDIRDLFLDTGLSTDSIAIMSQGNVDSILSSKPEERRAVFEEVAGISKYKTRKLEAERKLILSEQNLLRISDLKVEIAEQLISLETQARAAKEYKEIQGTLKQLELSTLKKQARTLIEKKEEITKELDEAKKQSKEKEDLRKKKFEERNEQHNLLKKTESDINIISVELQKVKDQIEEEKGNLILEKERNLFEEKGKLRDLKEEERFLSFELQKLQNEAIGLQAKKLELISKSKELETSDLNEFGEFKEIIILTSSLSEILKNILNSIYGKSWESLQQSSSSEKFKKLLESEVLRIDSEIEVSKKEEEFKTKKLEALKREISLEEEKLKGLLDETENFIKMPSGQNIEELILLKSEKEKLLSDFHEIKEKISQRIEDLEKESFSYGGVGEDVSEKILRQEVALARVDTELAQIEGHVRDEYSMSYEELLSFPEESSNISRSKKEIEGLKFRLRELEPVNLLAIDEYEKCKERSSFIDTQHQDIVMARENLKTLITELDLKAREDFIKSIEVLAQNFSQVFSELFEGGEAELILEKDKDALEAGIEISVRPAHRKWLNLSLLSGGERSLTAIALLFAILKTSPSPVCILDEVDAALDDANIGRFAAYLKKFSQTSQIIVITHNKRTMAVADTIYGVTMEEPGVSRVLSVKLEKAA